MMYDPGALLSLLWRMTAHPDQRCNYMLKSVDLIIKDNKIMQVSCLGNFNHFNLQLFLSLSTHVMRQNLVQK